MSSGYSQSASLRSSTPNNCSAVYQEELALLLIQASPHPLLIAFRNPAGDLLDLVKKYRAKSAGDTAVYRRNDPHPNSSRQTALSFPGKPRSLICNEKITGMSSELTHFYASSKNALYALYASYTSALLVTSHGACILSTATPLSMTSIP